jgi:hypothetical protein
MTYLNEFLTFVFFISSRTQKTLYTRNFLINLKAIYQIIPYKGIICQHIAYSTQGLHKELKNLT